MPTVQVKLVGALVRFLPADAAEDQAQVALAAGASVDDLIAQLGLPAQQRYLVAVNDDFIAKTTTATHILDSGDRVMIMPPLKGG